MRVLNCASGLYNTMLWLMLMALALAAVLAEPQAKDYLPPKHGGGASGGRRGDEGPSEPANYNYSYEVQDPSVNLDFGHNEKRVNDQATGSYHVLLPDGRTQIVDYEAGPDGYRPQFCSPFATDHMGRQFAICIKESCDEVRYEGTANLGGDGADGKGDGGYNYNAASNQQPVRQPAPISIAGAISKKPDTNFSK